ncbi:hypothetical protein LLB_3485 [Legionella longbeachae D-4968]|nr:hypothetical protein LLB_3485 [Legionella longbeachae D-4968]
MLLTPVLKVDVKAAGLIMTNRANHLVGLLVNLTIKYH